MLPGPKLEYNMRDKEHVWTPSCTKATLRLSTSLGQIIARSAFFRSHPNGFVILYAGVNLRYQHRIRSTPSFAKEMV